jgi:hypothetical protein
MRIFRTWEGSNITSVRLSTKWCVRLGVFHKPIDIKQVDLIEVTRGRALSMPNAGFQAELRNARW